MGEAEDEVVEIVRSVSGARRLNRHSRVYQDLGVSGDDAWEMLQRLVDRFSVSFAKLDFNKYFPGETEAFGEHWARMLGLAKPRPPLTIAHLVAVVERGQWFEPDVNSR